MKSSVTNNKGIQKKQEQVLILNPPYFANISPFLKTGNETNLFRNRSDNSGLRDSCRRRMLSSGLQLCYSNLIFFGNSFEMDSCHIAHNIATHISIQSSQMTQELHLGHLHFFFVCRSALCPPLAIISKFVRAD